MAETWDQLNLRAGQALAARNYADARQWLVRALAQRPDHADGWFNLGYAHRQLGDYAGALDAYDRALALGLSGPEAAHVNRAVILGNYLGRFDEAHAALDAALACNDNFLPAWLNLAEFQEDRGNAAAARKAYRRVLSLAPGNGRAHARLAALTLLDGNATAAVAALQKRQAAGLTANQDAVEILYALGNSLDAASRYDEAFSVIEAANRLETALRPPNMRYNPIAFEKLVDALCAVPWPLAGRAEPTSDADQALFICGMFRSGSTIFEQLLARHPAITAGGELEMIPAMVHSQLLPYPDRLTLIDSDVVAGLRRDYRAMLRTISPSHRYVSDKRPDNFLHLALIKHLFPQAKIIVTRRNPLDNILSILFLNFADSINYSSEVAAIVHYMTQYRRLMDHWQALFGDDLIFVDYEHLVADPAASLHPCLHQLGLDAAREDSGTANPVIRTPSNWQARGALHQRSVGRWRNYAAPLARYRHLLGKIDQS